MVTVVVNSRYEPYDVRIARPGIFGNPFKIGKDRDRPTAISEFRAYFLERVATDVQFKGRVLALKGKRLGCYCKPLACHGDVIVEYLEGYNEPGRSPG